jgi:hypothetical protein
MDENSKLLLTVAIPTATVLVGIVVNSRQLERFDRRFSSEVASLRNEINSRDGQFAGQFTAFRNEMIVRLERLESILDTRQRQLEETLRLRA